MKSDTVIKIICRHYKTEFDKIVHHPPKKRMKDALSWPRQVLEYCLLNFTTMTYSQISKLTKVHPRTVSNSNRKVQDQIDIRSDRGKEVIHLRRIFSIDELAVYFNNVQMKFQDAQTTINALNTALSKLIEKINEK